MWLNIHLSCKGSTSGLIVELYVSQAACLRFAIRFFCCCFFVFTKCCMHRLASRLVRKNDNYDERITSIKHLQRILFGK